MKLKVDIEKRLGDFHLRVSFETDGEVFALLGASGSGKSLTLKCIAGIEKPDRGFISFDDDVVFDSSSGINLPVQERQVGYLFQDYALFPHMTALENIMCGAKDKATARSYIDRFFLEGKESLKPARLSGGEKQRVAIARMLAASPRFIMLDEPFAALDSHLKTEVEGEIVKAIENCGGQAILVSHDIDEVYRLSDRIAVMDGGAVAEIQGKKELFDTPRTLPAARLTGCENIFPVEDGEKNGRIYRGFRARSLQVASPSEKGAFRCDIKKVTEGPFEALVQFVAETDDRLLTCKMSKEEWLKFADRKEPLYLRLPKEKIMKFEE